MNLFKKSFVKVFILFLVLIAFGALMPTNKAEAYSANYSASGSGCSMSGTISTDKDFYSTGEEVIVTATPTARGGIIGLAYSYPPPYDMYVYPGGPGVVFTTIPPDQGGDHYIYFTPQCDKYTGGTGTISYVVGVPPPPPPAVPYVLNPTATNISTTSATLGATVADLGDPAILSARGTCWGTSMEDPRLSVGTGTNCLPQGGTTLGTFTHSRTGLTSGTVYYRGYATNATGTGYSTNGSFITSQTTVSLIKNETKIKDIVARSNPDPQGTAYLVANISNLPVGQSCKLKNISDSGTTIYSYSLPPSGYDINLSPSSLIGNQNNFQIQCGSNPDNPPYTFTSSISNVQGQSGTLDVSTGSYSCMILVGENHCLIPFTWTTTNPRTDTTTWFVGGTPTTPGNSGTFVTTSFDGHNIPIGGTSATFTFTSNNKVDAEGQTTNPPTGSVVNELANRTITTNCATGSTWNGSICAGGLPDLVASTPTPTSAMAGNITFFSTITNNGNASTGTGFTNLFQRSSSSDGSNPINVTTQTTSALAGNGTTTITSTSMTLNVGTYYMRVCADKDANMAGTIYEGAPGSPAEGNNCSSGPPWTTITISNVPVSPTVTTTAITAITQTTATSGGNVTSDGGASVTSRGIVWSTSINPTKTSYPGGGICTNGSGLGSFPCNISGLTANTIYYVRAWATNSVNTSRGQELNFETLHPDLTASTPTPTSAVAGTITFSSTITNQGTYTTGGVSTHLFQRSSSPDGSSPINVTTTTPTILGDNQTATASVSMNLTTGTYYMRVCADNNASFVGTIYEGATGSPAESNNCSSGIPWTTVTVSSVNIVPTVTSPTATDITSTSVTLNAGVWSLGIPATLISPRYRGFCYSPRTLDPMWGDIYSTCVTEGGLTIGLYSKSFSGLTANSTYYFRGYATNATGTGYSSRGTFTTNTASLPDLLASVPSPTTTTVGVDTTFSSTIANAGYASTGESFFNLVQWSLYQNPINPSDVNDLLSDSMAPIPARSSSVYTKVHKFTTAGTFYMRVCADKREAVGTGTITEGNENNNCSSPWTAITVSGGPDLIADAPTPTTAIAGVAKSFSAKITNQGTVSTGAKFTNKFQTATGFNGLATPVGLLEYIVSPQMDVIPAGGNNNTSQSITFATAGTYYMRACADLPPDSNGVISESNENNNCSTPWTTITVTPSTPPTPTSLIATPSTCGTGTINLSWTASAGATNYRLLDGLTQIYFGPSTIYSHTGLTAGSSHSYTVRAENISGNSAYSNPVVAIAPAVCANIPPVANAGADKAITLPTSSVSVTGTASDTTPGTIGSTLWTKISGPATYSITSPSSLTTTITSMTTAGTYVFRLTATDNQGATGYDEMQVVVSSALIMSGTLTPLNPTCIIASGGNSCTQTLTWTTTNPEGTSAVTSPTGTPSPGNSVNNGSQLFTAPYNVSGVNFFLYNNSKLLDQTNVTTACTAGTTWNNSICANIPPVANAGADKAITLPTSSVSVTGTASDTPPGTFTTLWTKISGPATYSITSPSSLTTTITSMTTAGTYVFRLTATDNQGATGYDEMQVVVSSALVMSGTLTPATSSCTILSGGNSCTQTLTWTTTNPVGISAVTNNGTATPTSPSGNNSSQLFTIPYNTAMTGVTTFYLYNNGDSLVPTIESPAGSGVTVTTNCITGTSWITSNCAPTGTVPTVTSPTAYPITTTTATLKANVTSLGIPASLISPRYRGFCYGTMASPSWDNGATCLTQGGTTTGVYSKTITGLTPGTTYKYRGYATNTAGTGYSVDGTFTTLKVPTVTSPTVTSITSTSATLGANVTSKGIPATISARGTCWGTSTTDPRLSVGTGTNCLPQGVTTLGIFTHSRTGLPSNTLIYYRGYATNTTGTGYSVSGTFTTTAAITVPTVTTTPVTNITQTTAVGGGTIVSDGGAPVTVSGCAWSTSSNPVYDSAQGPISGNIGQVTNGPPTGSYSCSLSGLTANTLYHVRAYANNSAGPGYGADVTFTTQAPVVMSGTLTSSVPSCLIDFNESSCPVTLTFNVTNPETVLGSAVTSDTNDSGITSANFAITPPATTGTVDSGTKTLVAVPYLNGDFHIGRTFYLYNSGKSLVPTSPSGEGIIVNSSCTPGTNWDGARCVSIPVLCLNPLWTPPACDTCINGLTPYSACDTCTNGAIDPPLCITIGGGDGTCSDTIKNGNETGIDCGGRCLPGKVCKKIPGYIER